MRHLIIVKDWLILPFWTHSYDNFLRALFGRDNLCKDFILLSFDSKFEVFFIWVELRRARLLNIKSKVAGEIDESKKKIVFFALMRIMVGFLFEANLI